MYRNLEGYADPTAGAAFAAISKKEREAMSVNKKAKEYMNRAYRIDQRINAKIEQLTSLHSLATKATSTLSDIPGGGNRNKSSMENIIFKIMTLEDEINRDIDTLVDIKQDIMHIIKQVPNTEYQTILELRYLCYKPWEQIAVEMEFSMQHIYRMHDQALNKIALLLKDESKCD